jgi:hypothetical protein
MPNSGPQNQGSITACLWRFPSSGEPTFRIPFRRVTREAPRNERGQIGKLPQSCVAGPKWVTGGRKPRSSGSGAVRVVRAGEREQGGDQTYQGEFAGR